MSEKPVRILILGTGDMAASHARHFNEIPGVRVVAGIDISEARVKEFCKKHKIPRYFTDLEDAIAWGEFDAVSNVTPDAVHHPTSCGSSRRRSRSFARSRSLRPTSLRWR